MDWGLADIVLNRDEVDTAGMGSFSESRRAAFLLSTPFGKSWGVGSRCARRLCSGDRIGKVSPSWAIFALSLARRSDEKFGLCIALAKSALVGPILH